MVLCKNFPLHLNFLFVFPNYFEKYWIVFTFHLIPLPKKYQLYPTNFQKPTSKLKIKAFLLQEKVLRKKIIVRSKYSLLIAHCYLKYNLNTCIKFTLGTYQLPT